MEGSKHAAATGLQQAPSEQPAGQPEQQPAPAQAAKRTRLTAGHQQQAGHQIDTAPPKFTALSTRQHPRRHDGNSPAPKKAKALPPAHRLKALQAPADLQMPAEPGTSSAAPAADSRPSPEAIQLADAAPAAGRAGPSSSPTDLDPSKDMVDHPATALGDVSGVLPAADASIAAAVTGAADSQPSAATAPATAVPIVQLDDAAVAEAHVHVPRAQGDGASAELDLEQRLETPSAVQPPAASASAAVSAAAPAAAVPGPCDHAADAENIPESKPAPAGQPGALSGQQTHAPASHGAAGVASAASRGLQASGTRHAGSPSSSSEDATGRAGARKAGQPLAELSAAPSEDSQKSSADVSYAVHPEQSHASSLLVSMFCMLTERISLMMSSQCTHRSLTPEIRSWVKLPQHCCWKLVNHKERRSIIMVKAQPSFV